MLKPNAVQYLGIAFHELATNSAKYGVLSHPGGQVDVEWAVTTAANGDEIFGLVWRERDGPRLDGETRRGFGSIVLKRIAPQALGGTGLLEFGERGASWTLEAPLRYVKNSPDDMD